MPAENGAEGALPQRRSGGVAEREPDPGSPPGLRASGSKHFLGEVDADDVMAQVTSKERKAVGPATEIGHQ